MLAAIGVVALLYCLHWLSSTSRDAIIEKAHKLVKSGPFFRFLRIERGLVSVNEASLSRETFKTKTIVAECLDTGKIVKVTYTNKRHRDYEGMENLRPGEVFRYIVIDDPEHRQEADEHNQASRYLEIFRL